MRCPFLQEAEVQYCAHALLRKMIVRKQSSGLVEKCSTPEYTACSVYRQQPDPVSQGTACPYLQNSLMQFCSAAPVTRYIPYSEELLSRCGRDTFRYCDVYLTMARPDDPDTPIVDGIAIPHWLQYAPNHLWLDRTEDGLCHVGIDGMLAKVLNQVERISFLTTSGVQRPAAVLTAAGVDIHILFPNAMRITGTNSYLRANPAKLTADPYRLGWLFEGVANTDLPASVSEGLLPGGEAATRWMSGEVDRLSRFVHELTANPHEDYALMADGGSFGPDLLTHLDRSQALSLVHGFFSPSVTWTKGVFDDRR